MHLLDTDIVGTLRQTRPGGELTGPAAWASQVACETLFISAITLHELERTAAAAGQRDRLRRALWRSWIDDHVMRAFEGRILPVDTAWFAARRRSITATRATG